MPPRPLAPAIAPAIALALALALSLAAPPGAPAQPAGDASLARIEREVRDITLRLSHVADQRARLESFEGELSAHVDALKTRPAGVVRNAQLQEALKRLRTVLASKRELVQRQRILQTTLGTRKVTLLKAARREAAAHLARGRELVLMGDDDTARKAFAEAYDLLIVGEDNPNPSPSPVDTNRLPLPMDDFPLHGDETPEELREVAQVLRDSGEKARWMATSLEADLGRLQAERATLARLVSWVAAPPPSTTDIRARLKNHIGRLTRHIDLLHTHFAGLMARATELEDRADTEEAALLSDGQAP
ncbi:MAG: hypothetical protein HZA24_09770 [Nitrospirae bacterium]|nr:hypothetical protein [Nitrospirota bacterium]